MGSLFRLAIAIGAAYVLLRIGFSVLRGLARPVPEPPPSGELRRVNLRYRCPSCGTEMRMTRATEQLPAPPRHCMDEMELVAAPELE